MKAYHEMEQGTDIRVSARRRHGAQDETQIYCLNFSVCLCEASGEQIKHITLMLPKLSPGM